MNMKKLTPRQALTIVETVITSNNLDLTVSFDNQALKITHTKDSEEQAKSLIYLFSGTNPKNNQEEIPKDKGFLYLVKNNILFTSDVYFTLEEENHLNEDALDLLLNTVLEEDSEIKKPEKTNKTMKTADDIEDWIELLNAVKVSGHKYLYYIEGNDLNQLAENLQKLYNTPNAPLNKVLVSKFLEQFVDREVSEDYFINNFIEAAYKRLYSEHGQLKEGFSGVAHKISKSEHYASLLVLSVIDSFEAQNKVISLVEEYALPEKEKEKEPSIGWDDYLFTLGLESETIMDIQEYIEQNDIAEADPKRELSGLYTEVQSKMEKVKELAYKRSGIKNTRAEKNLDKYLDKTYFGKETPEKLRNVLDAYSLIESIGSYLDWLIQICENYMVGYAEVGVENEQESTIEEQEPPVEETPTNFDGVEESETDKFKLYLEYNMKLTETEMSAILEFLFDVEPSRYYKAAQGIAETMRIEIKESKKRVVDSLSLQPSASVKGRKITTKMNKYLKENYLEDNESTKANCLKLFAKVKSENSTIIAELEQLYKHAIKMYDAEEKNEMANLLFGGSFDFVVDRVMVTKGLRTAETDETETPEQLIRLEKRILDEYHKGLTEKVYNKSKDVIKEYKKLFGHAQ